MVRKTINKRHDGTSLVHSPCLSIVGLWRSVDVLKHRGPVCRRATVPAYTDMMCLTKAAGRQNPCFSTKKSKKIFGMKKKHKKEKHKACWEIKAHPRSGCCRSRPPGPS